MTVILAGYLVKQTKRIEPKTVQFYAAEIALAMQVGSGMISIGIYTDPSCIRSYTERSSCIGI